MGSAFNSDKLSYAVDLECINLVCHVDGRAASVRIGNVDGECDKVETERIKLREQVCIVSQIHVVVPIVPTFFIQQATGLTFSHMDLLGSNVS